MRLVKGFGLGKAKNKNEATSESENTDSIKVMGLKEKLNNRTKGLEEKEQKLNSLITGNGIEEASPHGPIEELSLETGELGKDDEIDDDIDDVSQTGKEPVIKVIQMSKISEEKPETPPKPAAGGGSNETPQPEASIEAATAPEQKSDSVEESLSSLFSSDEEEANPLANLINSLPDVTAQELVDDLSEIKGIINEWQKG